MLRAWRAKESLADRPRLRPWLYRIATNVCIDELNRRPRLVQPSDQGETDPGAPPDREAAWIEPCPDTWLEGVAADPAARYEAREGIALAFIAALRVLTPAQRATLLLRDVVGFSAREAAEALGLGVWHTVRHAKLVSGRVIFDTAAFRALVPAR